MNEVSMRRWTGWFVAAGAVALGMACEKELLFGPRAAAGIRLAPDTVVLQVGDTATVSGVVVDTAGSALLDLPVAWASSSPEIATVDATGVVTARAIGSAEVTASHEGFSRQAAVIVEPPPAIGLEPPSVVFTAAVGAGNPPPQTVNVVNAGGANLTGLSLDSVSYDPGASDWLDATLSGAEAPATLGLTAATALLTTVGTFSAGVSLRSDVATNSPSELMVSLVLTPGQPAALVKTAGDNQTVVAGLAVPVAPTVIVRDAFGNARPDVDVVFTVTGGNGSVTGAIATTDAQGLASVGSWTVQTDATSPSGPNGGRYPNTLEAAVTGVGSVTFTTDAIYSFATHVEPIFAASCTFGPCHAPAAVPPQLTPGVAHAQLVGVPSACAAGVLRVAAGQAGQSALIQLMDSVAVGGCVRSMPPRNRLADSLRNVVRSWIRNNALDN